MIVAVGRSREARWLIVANVVAAAVCAFIPLTDHLGFDFAEVLTIVNALGAPFVGFAAMRSELARRASERRPARAAAVAGLWAVGTLLAPTIVILLNALRRPICDPVSGLAWMATLPLPTAWLAATLGALIALRISGRVRPFTVILLIELATIGTTVAATYIGPAYFAFDHFAGYFPGPLYLATIPLSSALLTFRIATMLWGVAAITGAGALATSDTAARRTHAAWCASLLIALIAVSAVWGSGLGWRTTDRSLRQALNGEVRIDRLIIHFPREWTDRSVDQLTRDAAYDLSELEQAFGMQASHPIHVWMYASPAEKAKLVGAGSVSFAKPYRHEIHIHPNGFPHSPLRHELVHALGAEFAGGFFGTPGRGLPNEALVEGFAEAYEVDTPPITLSQRAKSMHQLGIAPDLVKLLSFNGFAGVARRRAYSYSGAFIRYLRNRFSPAAMRHFYRTGELSSLGNPSGLVQDFEHMLDTVSVDANDKSVARREFAKPAVSRQTCPHEVSAVVDSASALANRRLWTESLAMFDKACALAPDDPDLLAGKLSVAIRMKEPEAQRIQSIATALWSHPQLDPALESNTRQLVGDELWRRGDSAAAHTLYAAASHIPSGDATRRGIAVRLRALSDTNLANILRPILTEGEPVLITFFRLFEGLNGRPNDPLLLYLLGRQLRSSPERAGDYMERADAAGLEDPDFIRENLRTLVVMRAESNQCNEAERARVRLRAAGGSAVDDEVAADWTGRCRFSVSRGWKPLS